ncbi:MFS transporter [Paenibacillus peoriae]|uniref:MFS transporter n=1 Tax=Paenibacillus peoriae TaxID=59893 RepID=UPI00026C615B|nr:MFS transporter [Paenibacillus peoriae]MEC0184827.1 MFS transporter [Paenibacillus peoriae]
MSTAKPHLASKKEIFQYSLGGFGSNILFYLQLSFLMYFYTDVFGVSPTTVGSLFLGVRLLDAVFDPMMGILSDRTRTKWGKYRPYLIFGAPLLAAVTVLLFTAPDLSASGKIVYAAFTYLSYSLISSLVNVPFHSLTAIMSQDPNQTTTISTAKQFMGLPATIIVNAAVLPMVAFFGNGQQGWLLTAIILAVISSFSYWICASGTKRHDIINNRASEHMHPPIKTQLSLVSKNKPLLILMFSMFLNLVATTTNASVAVYFWQYNVNNVSLYSQISLWGLLLSVPMYALIPYFARKIGKKNVFLYGSIVSVIPTLIILLTPYENVMLLFIATILKTVLGPFSGAIVWAMIPDCVQYGNWKTGIQGAGTVTSSCVFVNKLGSAIGGVLAGLILGAVGYVAGHTQSPEVLRTILYLFAGVPLIAYIGTAIVLKFYHIPQEAFQGLITDHQEPSVTE